MADLQGASAAFSPATQPPASTLTHVLDMSPSTPPPPPTPVSRTIDVPTLATTVATQTVSASAPPPRPLPPATFVFVSGHPSQRVSAPVPPPPPAQTTTAPTQTSDPPCSSCVKRGTRCEFVDGGACLPCRAYKCACDRPGRVRAPPHTVGHPRTSVGGAGGAAAAAATGGGGSAEGRMPKRAGLKTRSVARAQGSDGEESDIEVVIGHPSKKFKPDGAPVRPPAKKSSHHATSSKASVRSAASTSTPTSGTGRKRGRPPKKNGASASGVASASASQASQHQRVVVDNPQPQTQTDLHPNGLPQGDSTPSSDAPAPLAPHPTPAQHDARLQALRAKLHDASVRVVHALPPPRVYVDLDLSLDVMDLQECMKQLDELRGSGSGGGSGGTSGSGGSGGAGGTGGGTGGSDARSLKEGKVLKLQRSIVARVPKQAGWCPGHLDFEDALADLCVRMKLYDQLSQVVKVEAE